MLTIEHAYGTGPVAAHASTGIGSLVVSPNEEYLSRFLWDPWAIDATSWGTSWYMGDDLDEAGLEELAYNMCGMGIEEAEAYREYASETKRVVPFDDWNAIDVYGYLTVEELGTLYFLSLLHDVSCAEVDVIEPWLDYKKLADACPWTRAGDFVYNDESFKRRLGLLRETP